MNIIKSMLAYSAANGAIANVNIVYCPKCGNVKHQVYWTDPPNGCAGGTLVLHCISCHHIFTFYDDAS